MFRSSPPQDSHTPTQGEGRRGPRVRFADAEEQNGPLEVLCGILSAVLAVTCLAGLGTMLAVLYMTVRPFSVPSYRRLACQLGASAFLEAAALLLPNTKMYLTGDSDIPSPIGTSLLVSNHAVHADWWVMLMLGRCVGLRGSMKYFLRNEYLNVDVQKESPDGYSRTKLTNGSALSSSRPSENGNGAAQRRPSASASTTNANHRVAPPDLSLAAKLLHILLDFPLLVNGDDYTADREQLFQLLRSFTEGPSVPVHLMLFPESWSMYNGADRDFLLAKSNTFARREGRPHLKHLLLPRTRGFNATLECLRESNPVVYDVTMAYTGYNGSLPPAMDLSLVSIWNFLRGDYPKEFYIRIKRYSMEEVIQDSSWLDKKWAEKDRLLSHFARHQSFPPDSRGYTRHRTFDTRHYSVESSLVSMGRLLLLPCAVPVLLLLSIPLFWTLLWIWVAHRLWDYFWGPERATAEERGQQDAEQTPVSVPTPFFPATPFASPSIMSWRDMLPKGSK